MTHLSSIRRVAVILCLVASSFSTRAENIIFPPGSGVTDVKADYGAKGDAVTDDTAAIQRAIDENVRKCRLLYFPDGTYLVSAKLTWGTDKEKAKQFVMQGQSEKGTIIKLKDNCPGFEDPAKKNFLLTMFEGGSTGMAFHNSLFHLTFNTGKGNPGAVGVQFMGNNDCAMRHVTIRSGDGAGVAGFDLTRTEPGPGLIKFVTIEGFDYGIDAVPGPFSMTFEHLTMRGQKKAAIRNKWHTLVIRDLQCENSVPVYLGTDSGPLTLVDSTLRGGKGGAAITGKGMIFLRDVKQEGYAEMVAARDGRPAVTGASVTEYTSNESKVSASAWGDSPRKSLRLPVEETPEIPWDAPAQWLVVDPEKLIAAEDDTAILQAAFDEAAKLGKTSVCIPNLNGKGKITISDTIRVSGAVRRIFGTDGPLHPVDAFGGAGRPLFRVEKVTGPVLFERFYVIAWKVKDFYYVEHATPQPLIMRDITSFGGKGYKNTPQAGTFFLENVCMAGIELHPGQKAFFRQWNPESNNIALTNNGGQLWMLSLKTETGGATIIQTTNGGHSELLGGLNYSSWKPLPEKQPMFIVEDATASFTIGQISFDSKRGYNVVIRETRKGQTKELTVTDAAGPGKSFNLITAGATASARR